MMGHREPMKGGDEYDAFTGWRKVTFWQRQELRKIKRRFSKRVRRINHVTLAFAGLEADNAALDAGIVDYHD